MSSIQAVSRFLILIVALLYSFAANTAVADSVDSTYLTCVSFRAATNLAQANTDSQAINRELLYSLGGITSFDGYLIDTVNHDVILIGTVAPGRPTLHLDDFAVILRNVWNGASPPYCSLEPDREDLLSIRRILNRKNSSNSDDWLQQIESNLADIQRDWHAQKVIVKGIPRTSHHARIMIDADYHMKRVTLGLLAVPGVTSYLERFVAYNRQSAPSEAIHNAPFSAARFWFHIHSFDASDSAMVPYPHFETNDQLVVLKTCQVILLTEKQLIGDKGNRIDTSEPDTLALMFSHEFSDQYDRLTSIQTSYALLEQLFRMNALVRAMRLWNVFGTAGISPDTFLKAYTPQLDAAAPDTMPGLVNFAKIEKAIQMNDKMYTFVQFPIAYGGVDMTFPVTKAQFMHNHNAELDTLLSKILMLRPRPDSGVWRIATKKLPR